MKAFPVILLMCRSGPPTLTASSYWVNDHNPTQSLSCTPFTLGLKGLMFSDIASYAQITEVRTVCLDRFSVKADILLCINLK